MSARRFLIRTLIALFVVGTTLPAFAEVKTPSIFGSGMVLQRGMDVPVWGWADAGEKVTVSFRDQTVSTTAGSDGTWKVKLKPLDLGDAATLTVKGKNELAFDDVLVGEVWICSGQSNMGMTVARALDADLEAAAANYPELRLFQVPNVTAETPQDDVPASWRVCAPDNVSSFSAVGYFFGRNLHQVLQVPVGIVMTAWGGTRAEAWTSPEAMHGTPELKPLADHWNALAENYDPQQAQATFEKAQQKWQARVKEARAANQAIPRKPQLIGPPRLDRHHPSTLFNAMVHPLAPFAIRGAIWYQGEGNSARAYQYRTLMPTMIQSWRETWGQGNFPFYQVQLANFQAQTDEPGDSAWAELREAQDMAGDKIPHVDAACIIDLGAAKDIHPKDKQNVADRLARLALVNEYGMTSLVKKGPTFKSMSVTGNTATIEFETYGSPLITYYREPLSGFAIAGNNKSWKWADATITGKNTVEVSHPAIKDPKAVRYNWANNPQGTLYNEAYLPAYPFRTDDWEGVTVNNQTP